MRDKTQVLVVGGGPAGSTSAGLLARQGFQVTLLERDRFPRYHIGESILPSCRPILELLGVWDRVASHGFVEKRGAYFFWGEEEWEVRFSDMGDGANAWQVVRSEFDEILLDHAASLGVDVREGAEVKDLEIVDGRPIAARWRTDDGEAGRIAFDHVIDASGRGGVMATRHLANRKPHSVFRNVAAWTYWRRTKATNRGPAGAIIVASTPGGWFWSIPLHDGTRSIGLVTGRERFNRLKVELGGPRQVYDAALRECPAVLGQITGAQQDGKFRVEQDYSYVADTFARPGYYLSGDAACFLDPLLSTGVHLATYSGMLAAASLGSLLRGETSELESQLFYQTVYRHAYERLLVLVSVFYESYRGKDYHFYNAQQLSPSDRTDLHLQAAFDRIVTGIADLRDAQDVYSRVRGHIMGAESGDPNPLGNLNRVHEQKQAPTRPGNAVEGFYISFTPSLGLKRGTRSNPTDVG
jgi:flavin-dependent dehydrogenase